MRIRAQVGDFRGGGRRSRRHLPIFLSLISTGARAACRGGRGRTTASEPTSVLLDLASMAPGMRGGDQTRWVAAGISLPLPSMATRGVVGGTTILGKGRGRRGLRASGGRCSLGRKRSGPGHRTPQSCPKFRRCLGIGPDKTYKISIWDNPLGDVFLASMSISSETDIWMTLGYLTESLEMLLCHCLFSFGCAKYGPVWNSMCLGLYL